MADPVTAPALTPSAIAEDARQRLAGEAKQTLAQIKQTQDGPPPSATPSNAVEGAARLAYLISGRDPEWLARFNAGHAETMREYHSLVKMKVEADPVELALAGVVPSHLEFEYREQGVASLREMASAVPDFRRAGIPDEATAHFLRDLPAEPKDYETAVRWKEEALATPEWRAGYLAGHPAFVGPMKRANMLIVAGPKKAK
jgi:hypothetical protein